MSDSLKPGDHVYCTYRLPSVVQPWQHPVFFGTILEPGDSPAEWNGYNSERFFCERTGRMPVQYHKPAHDTFIQHDSVDSLVKITAADLLLTPRERIFRILGAEAERNYQRAMSPRHQRAIA